MDNLIQLIDEEFTQDDLGIQTSTETKRNIWARIQSVKRADWYAAGRNGLQPSLVAVTPVFNYAGEKIAVVQGRRYSIYRTFSPEDSDYIELYLEEKAGV